MSLVNDGGEDAVFTVNGVDVTVGPHGQVVHVVPVVQDQTVRITVASGGVILFDDDVTRDCEPVVVVTDPCADCADPIEPTEPTTSTTPTILTTPTTTPAPTPTTAPTPVVPGAPQAVRTTSAPTATAPPARSAPSGLARTGLSTVSLIVVAAGLLMAGGGLSAPAGVVDQPDEARVARSRLPGRLRAGFGRTTTMPPRARNRGRRHAVG